MTRARVLVVDDDPHIRELLTVNLRAAGYATESAADGHQALARAGEHMPDVVVLDVMMPVMDGWETCKVIRDDPVLSQVKVLMLTAKDAKRDRLIGTEILGADDYLVKPFDIGSLLLSVGRLAHGTTS